MSEYWKSTPKYWCDHCKVYVRDTKLEKVNHESTGKHQGNLSKYLRNIHKDNDREERDKQRAKNEVARLNGGAPSSNSGLEPKITAAGSSVDTKRQATAEERKKQIAQLAAMGVAVPEQYRRDMAMAGDWQTVRTTRIANLESNVKTEGEDAKSASKISGVKRPMPEVGLDEEEPVRKRVAWGSATKSYEGVKNDDELEALLSSTTTIKRNIKQEENEVQSKTETNKHEGQEPNSTVSIKAEPGDEEALSEGVEAKLVTQMKQDPAEEETEVVFKKRKPKIKKEGPG